MYKALYTSALVLLAIGVGLTDDKKPIQPDWPVEVVPKKDVVVPDVMPGPLSSLAMGDWYVVQSDEEVQLLSSPPGVVSVTAESGPIKLRGKFSDGKGIETRWYGKKQVFIVERVLEGNVELIQVPKGDVKRRLLTDGVAPIPPPKPPTPKPVDPVVPVKVDTFRVVMVFESADTLTIEQKAAIYAKAVTDYLTAKCTPEGGYAGWRRYDPQTVTTNEQPNMKAFWEKVKPKLPALPCIAVEVNGGEPAFIPITTETGGVKTTLKPQGVIDALKKYRGE